MDAMVHSAQELLRTPSPRDEDDVLVECVSLRDYMDSFPLVPLAIISRLSESDLIQCATGLRQLQQSLSMDQEDDVQLGKYVARQLTLVDRQMETARARDRVRKLLTGEVAVALVPVVKTENKPLPVFLQPQSQAQPQVPSPCLSKPPRLSNANSTVSLPSGNGVKRKQDAVQLAKAITLARATATTAFVITATESRQRAKRKRALVKKKTKEDEDRERAQQIERERDARRQAAYQRLMARQALQSKKQQSKKDKSTSEVDIGESQVHQAEKDDASSSLSDESDESDVSNCSESDAANEQAILAMEVVIREEPVDESTPKEEPEVSNERVEDEEVIENAGDDEEDDVNDEEEDPEQQQDSPCATMTSSVMAEGSAVEHEDNSAWENENKQVNESGAEIEPSQVPELLEEEQVQEPQRETGCNEVEIDQEQQEKDAITSQLQQFIAERAQRTLDALQLKAREGKQPRNADTTVRVRPETPTEPPSTNIEPPRTSTGCSHQGSVISIVENAPEAASEGPTPAPAVLTLSRPPSKPISDYRAYFANFFCILTSVYEQRAALTASTPTATFIHHGEHALQQQLKLYQSWQSIMDDYATVFGSPNTTASSPSTAHYRINSQTRSEVSEIVVTALEKLGEWEEHPSGLGLKTTWNLLWTWSKPRVERKTLLAWQKVNHIHQAKELTRKDCLKKNIGKYLAVGGRLKQAYDFTPMSFLLPQEYVAFVTAFQERARRLAAQQLPPSKNIWIMKPVALSRGRGISLVNELSQVVYGEQVVIQEYIANPLLLDGFKFDLRLYVLVTSFNPLEAFFYEDGFIRLCTRAYEDSDLSNLFVHLTNSSIQKTNQDVELTPESEAGGTKMTLEYLWQRLEAMGADVPAVKNEIFAVLLKSLLCGEDQIPFQVNSFDLLGYDILLDADFRPWLIEINSSPSMARENDLDYQVKDALIYDTLRLVDPLRFDRNKLADVIRRRFHDAEMEKKRAHAITRHPRETEELTHRQLNEDLTEILHGRVPRLYGEVPEHLGRYTRLCPHTTLYNQLVKLKKSCLRK
ncbi:hypothetical protein Poli38472_007361 [Pythium oligandrum]|uniref:Tubulin-tyrosine ligase n=1 Tax=Pythium oligandrum TaxID=41045 RepID=A0A8K1CA65_PYTOL|nr:hypothetical protein Poli38472_007361 [Pythium oligandrum]|eukprot:TMW59216.1 hypothetical protein Poli38472_007361 [Pythium oligandrum]